MSGSTRHTERRRRYHSFSSDQFTGFRGIVISGTLHDVIHSRVGRPAGAWDQPVPKEPMTDSAGYSDLVFGLCELIRSLQLGEECFFGSAR